MGRRLRSVGAVCAWLAALSIAAACVGSDPDPISSTTNDSGAPTTTGDATSAIDDEGGLPPLPEPALPCDPTELPKDGIHVATDGADDSGDGTPLLPLRTIGAAIRLAVTAAKENIYVAEGTYNEALAFDASHQGVTVAGGWLRSGETWKRDCAEGFRTRTVVASPANVAVRVTAVTKPTALDTITVATKAASTTANDEAGETCIGVLVSGDASSFRMNRVKVVAGRPGNGGGATPAAQPGAKTCDGVTDCSASTPAVPAAAANAAVTTLMGSFTADGFKPQDGAAGKAGIAGGNGTKGSPGEAKVCATPGVGQCQSGGNQCVDTTSPQGNAPSGLCGCGGLAGKPGAAGRGGGASISLLVSGAGSTVVVQDTALVASNGGDGSAGAVGGLGGTPTNGTKGATVSCPQNNQPTGPLGAGCGCGGKNDKSFAGGAAGGPGAAGGSGGGGSGGAGGDSIAYVTLGSAKVVTQGSQGQLQHGTAGHGAGGAPDGRSADNFVAP